MQPSTVIFRLSTYGFMYSARIKCLEEKSQCTSQSCTSLLLMSAWRLVHRPVADRCSQGAGYTGLFLAPVQGPTCILPCIPKLITLPCHDASIHWTALREASRDSVLEMSNKPRFPSPVPHSRNHSQVLKMGDTRRTSSSARAMYFETWASALPSESPSEAGCLASTSAPPPPSC